MYIRGPYFKVFLKDPEDYTPYFEDYYLALEYYLTSFGFLIKDYEITKILLHTLISFFGLSFHVIFYPLLLFWITLNLKSLLIIFTALID